MTQLTIFFGLVIVAGIYIIHTLIVVGRQERADLEDRLMALSKPEALISHRVMKDPQPAEVHYMDEDQEAAAQSLNGHPDLIGDEYDRN